MVHASDIIWPFDIELYVALGKYIYIWSLRIACTWIKMFSIKVFTILLNRAVLHKRSARACTVTSYRSQVTTPDMFKNPASNGVCKDIDICINRWKFQLNLMPLYQFLQFLRYQCIKKTSIYRIFSNFPPNSYRSTQKMVKVYVFP